MQLDHFSKKEVSESINDFFACDFEAAFPEEKQEEMFRAIDKIANNRQHALQWSLIQIAKQHNLFSGVDRYMRELARVLWNLNDKHLCNVLESALNKEIAIPTPGAHKQKFISDVLARGQSLVNEDAKTVHHNLLA